MQSEPSSNSANGRHNLSAHQPPDVSMQTRGDSLQTEIFIRKVFEEDPKKGCELLFKHYYQPLCSHAVRFVYSKEVAEDLVSDLFYTFWEKKHYAEVTSSYRAYLFIATRNRALKYLRKEFGKSDDLGAASDEHYNQPSPHALLEYNELLMKLDAAIQKLTPQSRKIFLMNRFEGKKYQEIASALNVSLKTVEAHMSKALEVLRRVVRNDLLIITLIYFLLGLG